jgi:hypothetical protein
MDEIVPMGKGICQFIFREQLIQNQLIDFRR